jgi:hypothetical protein
MAYGAQTSNWIFRKSFINNDLTTQTEETSFQLSVGNQLTDSSLPGRAIHKQERQLTLDRGMLCATAPFWGSHDGPEAGYFRFFLQKKLCVCRGVPMVG